MMAAHTAGPMQQLVGVMPRLPGEAEDIGTPKMLTVEHSPA
ncbi:MAG: hypothetical protein SVT52_06840 [Planctomycetota bacterium]|nr:hypothetical protein [Planctomycetota bacterium]